LKRRAGCTVRDIVLESDVEITIAIEIGKPKRGRIEAVSGTGKDPWT